jgi:hypothetical protein
MYELTRTETSPTKTLIFQGTNIFIHVDLNLKVNADDIDIVITESRDGISLHFPVVNQPAVETLPTLSGNLEEAIQIVISHFESHDFVLIDTLPYPNE